MDVHCEFPLFLCYNSEAILRQNYQMNKSKRLMHLQNRVVVQIQQDHLGLLSILRNSSNFCDKDTTENVTIKFF